MAEKTIPEVVTEVLTYVPQHRATDRAIVLAEILNEHGEPLELALRALPAEDQTRIGLDDIVDRSKLSAEEMRRLFIGDALAHDPRKLPY